MMPLYSKFPGGRLRASLVLTFSLELHTFKNPQQTAGHKRLKTVAFRTFVGAFCTLVSSVVYVTPCTIA